MFLIPIAISTWYGGRRTGILFSLLSAAALFAVDISERIYINHFVLIWNILTRFGFFLITEELFHEIKNRLDNERYLSRTDSLTRLLSMRGFMEEARKLFRLSVRHKRPIAVAFLDLDNFKELNDMRGHHEGDRVLQVVGKTILVSLRETDVAGRLGGDEFVMVLPETDDTGARTVLGTLRDSLRQEAKQYDWQLSVSMGVVTFDSAELGVEEVIKLADSLMYRVKKWGGKTGFSLKRSQKRWKWFVQTLNLHQEPIFLTCIMPRGSRSNGIDFVCLSNSR